MRSKRKRTPEGGFPLAAVVLLVTTVAALLACIDMSTAREELQAVARERSFYVIVGVVFLVGTFFGGILGWMQPRRLRSVLIGGPLAGIATLVLVLLVVFPASLWQCLAAIAVLPISSIVVRINAR